MARLCSLMSVSANSMSRSSGTHRMSVTSFFVKPTLPAPMKAIFRAATSLAQRSDGTGTASRAMLARLLLVPQLLRPGEIAHPLESSMLV